LFGGVKVYGYVYITTNLINNKRYIGQHKGEFDTRYIGSGLRLWDDVKVFGRENFVCEVIEYCETKEELDQKEIEIIKLHNAVESIDFYNIAHGGYGGILYERRDKEHNPFFGKKQTEFQKQQVSKALKGKKRPPEVVAKWSKTQKGKILTEEHKLKLGKKQVVLDIYTNETLSFNSVKELVEKLNIKRHDYDNAKRYKKLIVKRYQIIKEEDKYGRNKCES
jgi:group I intron endonuclease